MDIDIIEEDENPMLHRTDVRFEVAHDEATPSRLSVRDSLAAMLNKDATEVVIHELDTKFGMRKTVGYAKVYETSEHAQDVEQDHMLQRNKIAADGEGVIEAEPAEDDEESAEVEADAEEAEAEDSEEAQAEDAEEEEAEEEEAEEAEAEDAEDAEAEEAEEAAEAADEEGDDAETDEAEEAEAEEA